MLFPDAKRTIYKNNVLEQVICQLRFPTILKIDTEVPSRFQEVIRHRFPIYKQTNEGADPGFPDGIAQLIPRELIESFAIRGNLRFQFLSSNREWTVSLTREFVALSTTNYTSWEEFRKNMDLIIGALLDVYAPAFITRVGLRYQNIIDRKLLNLEGFAWKNLIEGYVLGPLAENTVADAVAEHRNTLGVRLEGQNDFVRLEHGLVIDSDSDGASYCYKLDNDLYSEEEAQANAEYLTQKLDYLNAANRRLFNWCITDRLRTAMESAT